MAGSQTSHSLNETGNSDDEQQTRIAETVDRPPSHEDGIRPPKIYEPLSFPVLVLLMPASIFGVLSRLGLQALTTFDGQSIFPLAYVQAVGCLIMGMGMRVKEPLGQLFVASFNISACFFRSHFIVTDRSILHSPPVSNHSPFQLHGLTQEGLRILWFIDHLFQLAIGYIQFLDQLGQVSSGWITRRMCDASCD